MLYISEYLSGNRTAQVLKNLTTNQYVVYCFCCGNEAQSEPFDTETAAEDWAEDWVEKQVELEAFAEIQPASDSAGCGCHNG